MSFLHFGGAWGLRLGSSAFCSLWYKRRPSLSRSFSHFRFRFPTFSGFLGLGFAFPSALFLKLAVPSFLVKQLQVFHHCLFEPEKFAEKKWTQFSKKRSGHRQKNMDFSTKKPNSCRFVFIFLDFLRFSRIFDFFPTCFSPPVR